MSDIQNQQNVRELTMSYVLEQIERIVSQTDHIHQALEQLEKVAQVGPGEFAGAEKAKAIAEAVRARETTNQQALRLYEKMYDDLKPQKENLRLKAAETIAGVVQEVACSGSDLGLQAITDMLDTIRHMD